MEGTTKNYWRVFSPNMDHSIMFLCLQRERAKRWSHSNTHLTQWVWGMRIETECSISALPCSWSLLPHFLQQRALDNEKGLGVNPLTLSWVSDNPTTETIPHPFDAQEPLLSSKHPVHSFDSEVPQTPPLSSTERDYESVTLMRMRQAEERRRLCQQLAQEEELTWWSPSSRVCTDRITCTWMRTLDNASITSPISMHNKTSLCDLCLYVFGSFLFSSMHT